MNRAIELIEQDALQCLSQPATDDVVEHLKRGEFRQGLAILLREEGRWLSQADAERLIEHWCKALG